MSILSPRLPGPTGQTCHIKNPRLPQFRFEWHRDSKRVYLVRLGGFPEIGEPIAYEVADQGQATNAVLIWCRGYHEGRREAALKLAG
jgi:hypothetical protein